jgi:hypothetical protein
MLYFFDIYIFNIQFEILNNKYLLFFTIYLNSIFLTTLMYFELIFWVGQNLCQQQFTTTHRRPHYTTIACNWKTCKTSCFVSRTLVHISQFLIPFSCELLHVPETLLLLFWVQCLSCRYASPWCEYQVLPLLSVKPISHASLPLVAGTLFYFLLRIFSSTTVGTSPCQSIDERWRGNKSISCRGQRIYETIWTLNKSYTLPQYHKVRIRIHTLEVTPPGPISAISLPHVNCTRTVTRALRSLMPRNGNSGSSFGWPVGFGPDGCGCGFNYTHVGLTQTRPTSSQVWARVLVVTHRWTQHPNDLWWTGDGEPRSGQQPSPCEYVTWSPRVFRCKMVPPTKP